MSAERLIADLRARGVALVADGPHLRCRPRSSLTEEDLATLRHIKPAVLEYLRHEEVTPPSNVVCYACKTCRFWLSIHGVMVCGLCHPPASPDLVAEWIKDDSGDA